MTLNFKWAGKLNLNVYITLLPAVLRITCLPKELIREEVVVGVQCTLQVEQQAIGVTRSVCLPSLPPPHCRVCTHWSGDHYTIDVWRTAGP